MFPRWDFVSTVEADNTSWLYNSLCDNIKDKENVIKMFYSMIKLSQIKRQQTLIFDFFKRILQSGLDYFFHAVAENTAGASNLISLEKLIILKRRMHLKTS